MTTTLTTQDFVVIEEKVRRLRENGTTNPIVEDFWHLIEAHRAILLAEESPRRCPADRYCSKHRFVHGGEAEELRKGIERLIVDADDTKHRLGAVVRTSRLMLLLDEVDARDSLAYLEAKGTVAK